MEFVLAFIGFMFALTLISWFAVLISAGVLHLYQIFEAFFRKHRHD